MTIKAECTACSATGLYKGFCEPEGVAVVCHGCNGKGFVIQNIKEFNYRKHKREIHTVCKSRGSFIGTGVGPIGRSITYKEFQDGKMP